MVKSYGSPTPSKLAPQVLVENEEDDGNENIRADSWDDLEVEVSSDFLSPRSGQLSKQAFGRDFLGVLLSSAQKFVCGKASKEDLLSPRGFLRTNNKQRSTSRKYSKSALRPSHGVKKLKQVDVETKENITAPKKKDALDEGVVVAAVNEKAVKVAHEKLGTPLKTDKEGSSKAGSIEHAELGPQMMETEEGGSTKAKRDLDAKLGPQTKINPPKDVLDLYGEAVELHICAKIEANREISLERNAVDIYGETVESHLCAPVEINSELPGGNDEKQHSRAIPLFADSSSIGQEPRTSPRPVKDEANTPLLAQIDIQAHAHQNVAIIPIASGTTDSGIEDFGDAANEHSTSPEVSGDEVKIMPHGDQIPSGSDLTGAEDLAVTEGQNLVLIKKAPHKDKDGIAGQETPVTMASSEGQISTESTNDITMASSEGQMTAKDDTNDDEGQSAEGIISVKSRSCLGAADETSTEGNQEGSKLFENIDDILKHPNFEAALEKYLKSKGKHAEVDQGVPPHLAFLVSKREHTQFSQGGIALAPHLTLNKAALDGVGSKNERGRADPPSKQEAEKLESLAKRLDPPSFGKTLAEAEAGEKMKQFTYQSSESNGCSDIDKGSSHEVIDLLEHGQEKKSVPESNVTKHVSSEPTDEGMEGEEPLVEARSIRPLFVDDEEQAETESQRSGTDDKTSPASLIEETDEGVEVVVDEEEEEIVDKDEVVDDYIKDEVVDEDTKGEPENDTKCEAPGREAAIKSIPGTPCVDLDRDAAIKRIPQPSRKEMKSLITPSEDSGGSRKDPPEKPSTTEIVTSTAVPEGHEMMIPGCEDGIERFCNFPFFPQEVNNKKVPDTDYPAEVIFVVSEENHGDGDHSHSLTLPEEDPTLEARASTISPTNGNVENEGFPSSITRSFRNQTGSPHGGDSLVVSDFGDSGYATVDPILGPLANFSSSQFSRSTAAGGEDADDDSNLLLALTRSESGSEVGFDSTPSPSAKENPQSFARVLETRRNQAVPGRPSTPVSVSSSVPMPGSMKMPADGQHHDPSRSPRMKSVLERLKHRRDPMHGGGHDVSIGARRNLADDGPVDPDDLFNRYNTIVKGMVVSDASRLQQVQGRPVENLQSAQGVIDVTQLAKRRQRAEKYQQISLLDKDQQTTMGRSSSSGSEYSTTPSEKARELRRQLDQALKTSNAIRGTQERLSEEISSFKSKLQAQREAARHEVEAITASISPRRKNPSPKNYQRSPQGKPSVVLRGRSPGERDPISPSTRSSLWDKDPPQLAVVESTDTENSPGGDTSGSEADEDDVRLQQLDSIIHGLKHAQQQRKADL